MSAPTYLRGMYAAKILPDGALEMRDPNDNARHRYRWQWRSGVPCRLRLPEIGDFRDVAAQWEPVGPMMCREIERVRLWLRMGRKHVMSTPVAEYFARTAKP